MEYCKTCGNQINENDSICPLCGSPVNGGEFTSNIGGSSVLETALKKINTSATIWMIIGVLQILFGLPELCVGYGITSIAIGIWNIVQSTRAKKNVEYFHRNPAAIVSYYEGQLTTIIIFLILNFLFGNIFGIIGSIYELTIRSYVLNNKDSILNA